MEQSRILFLDRKGNWHKVVSVGMVENEDGPNLYFLFPTNFSFAGDKKFHEVHLRYPPDGNVHLQFKDPDGKKITGDGVEPLYSQHESLTELTPAKRIFTIIPKSIDHYPIHDKPQNDFDWPLEYTTIPDFFIEQPVRLNFWIGKGSESQLLSKASAIQQIEMQETLRYVQVFQGQNKDYQFFVAVSRPQELLKFPNAMELFLHNQDSAKKLRRSIK